MIVVLVTMLLFAAPLPDPPPVQPQPDDLARKLIRKSVDETEQDPMDKMLADMQQISQKLHDEFDPGEQTQSLQRQVTTQLDEAIKAAAARRRAKSQSDPKQVSDKRTMPAGRKTQSKPADTQDGAAAMTKPEQSTAPAGDGKSEKPDGRRELPGTRRAWGHLPQRDREEVLQGAEEQSLERYRQWIEQYFRALQESDK